MTTDGGGWTLVVRALGTSNAHRDAAAVGSLTNPSQTSVAKYSDAMINSFAKTMYRGKVDTITAPTGFFRATVSTPYSSVVSMSPVDTKKNLADSWVSSPPN